MKNYFYLLFFIFILAFSCKSTKSGFSVAEQTLASKNDSIKSTQKTINTKNDTIRIANDSLKYEVIIIDPGFSTWLASRSFPRGYHAQSFMENKNYFYITEWNSRVLQPQRFTLIYTK